MGGGLMPITNHGSYLYPMPVRRGGELSGGAVDWYDLREVEQCARSQQAGLTPVYFIDAGLTQIYTNGETTNIFANWSANGYRLPTEAEWEKAAARRVERASISIGEYDFRKQCELLCQFQIPPMLADIPTIWDPMLASYQLWNGCGNRHESGGLFCPKRLRTLRHGGQWCLSGAGIGMAHPMVNHPPPIQRGRERGSTRVCCAAAVGQTMPSICAVPVARSATPTGGTGAYGFRCVRRLSLGLVVRRFVGDRIILQAAATKSSVAPPDRAENPRRPHLRRSWVWRYCSPHGLRKINETSIPHRSGGNFLASVVSLAVVSYVDYLTVTNCCWWSFISSPLPSAPGTRNVKSSSAGALSVAFAGCWSDYYSGHRYSHPIYHFWNGFICLCLLCGVWTGLQRLKTSLNEPGARQG